VRKIAFRAGLGMAVLTAAIGVDLLAVVGIWLVLFAFLMQADAEWPAVLGRRPVLDWLGKRSYAFYMSFAIAELLMSQFFDRMGWVPKGHGLVFAAGMLAITLALATTLHMLVEMPCRRLADRWLPPPQPAAKTKQLPIFPQKVENAPL